MKTRPSTQSTRSRRRSASLACAALLLGLVAAPRSASAAAAPAAFPTAPAGPMSLADLTLKELLELQFNTVSTASRRRQKLWEAPASVSIVTRDDIKAFGYRTLADAIGGTPGVYSTEDRYYSYLGVRGFNRPGDYNSRVLLLVDGSRANDNLYDSGWLAHGSPVNVDDVERVEFVRGPSSSLYGSSAFFGTVSVISRRGGSLNGAEVTAEAGSLRTYRGRVAVGYAFKSGFEFYLSGSRFRTRGQERLYFAEFDAPETNAGVAENLDHEHAWHVNGNATYRGFTLTVLRNYRERAIPTGSFGSRFNDPRADTIDSSGHYDLKFEHALSDGTQLMARVGFHHYAYDGVYPVDLAADGEPEAIVLNLDEAHGDWWGTEATATRSISERLTLIAGAELRMNVRQDQSNLYATDPVDVLLERSTSSRVHGFYGQADWTPRSNLIISAGVRYDHFSTFGGTANPRFGVNYQPWTTSTVKLLHGRAFRAPNAYELDYYPAAQNPGPRLRPETVKTYEAVFEQALSDAVKVTASGSFYRVNDLITLAYGDDFSSFWNLGRADTRSGEFGLEGRWLNGWFGRLSYTTQRTDDGTGAELNNSPRSLTKAHLRVPLHRNRVFLGAEFQRIGSSLAVQGGRVDPSWFANVTLFSRDILGRGELAASVYNVFDRAILNTGFEEHRQRVLQQNGRTFRVRYTFRY
jgi:iron complex outermembrane receptor protein